MTLRKENRQMSMYIPNLEELVRKDHPYRKLLKLVDFDKLSKPLESLYSKTGAPAYPVSSAVKMLIVQYLDDCSDREMEEHMADSLAAKLFCGFGLKDPTPDHSYFGKLRKRIGTKRIAQLFNDLRDAMKKAGYVGEVFSFVDSTTLESKIDIWEARDKAVVDNDNDDFDDDGNRRLSNSSIAKYIKDPQARFGCKGKNKFWIGYKRHACIDMKQGLITKVAVTPANVHDSKAFKHVCPDSGMVFADKAYSIGEAQKVMKIKGCHSGAIKRKNDSSKNRDKDRWISGIRMPFEGAFSKMNRTARYDGIAKNQFQAFMQAIAFNLKRLITIEADTIAI